MTLYGAATILSPESQTLQFWESVNSAVENVTLQWLALFSTIRGIAMAYKKFLVPVAAAIAALFSNTSQAITPPSVSTTNSPAPVSSTLATHQSNDPIIQSMRYQIGTEEHVLTMRKPASGSIYAQHQSHWSHSSHESHSSHSSHRSGY